jgi:hypothetical protein
LELTKEFIDRIDKEFAGWRRRKGQAATVQNVVEFLLGSGFIPETIANRWLVIQLYPEELAKTKTKKRPTGSREQALLAVSGITGIPRTTIQTILAHKNRAFKGLR